MKKIIIILMIGILAGCSNRTIEKKGTYTSLQGNEVKIQLEMKDHQIKDVDIDEIEDGISKKEKKYDYGMKKASSIQKEWFEQVDFLEDYIEKNGIEGIDMNEQGKAINEDVKAGCTIAIDSFINAIREVKEQ